MYELKAHISDPVHVASGWIFSQNQLTPSASQFNSIQWLQRRFTHIKHHLVRRVGTSQTAACNANMLLQMTNPCRVVLTLHMHAWQPNAMVNATPTALNCGEKQRTPSVKGAIVKIVLPIGNGSEVLRVLPMLQRSKALNMLVDQAVHDKCIISFHLKL